MAGGDVIVFICCSREMRSGFADHLRSQLTGSTTAAGKVTVVMGSRDLPKGVNLRQAIRRAIESSSFSVVIVCPGFASSQFRLDELAHIMELQQQRAGGDGGHVCLPVFYRTSPDDDCAALGAGSSCFSDCFDGHKARFSYRRVEAWIRALAWLAGISGWVLTAHRSEAAVVKEIVTAIQDGIRKRELTSSCGHHDQCPNLEPYNPSSASTRKATISTRSAPTMSFRIVIVAAATSAFGGVALVLAIYVHSCNYNTRFIF